MPVQACTQLLHPETAHSCRIFQLGLCSLQGLLDQTPSTTCTTCSVHSYREGPCCTCLHLRSYTGPLHPEVDSWRGCHEDSSALANPREWRQGHRKCLYFSQRLPC